MLGAHEAAGCFRWDGICTCPHVASVGRHPARLAQMQHQEYNKRGFSCQVSLVKAGLLAPSFPCSLGFILFLFGLILSNSQFKEKKSWKELFEKAWHICCWLQVAFFFASSLWSAAFRDPELYCCRCWDVAELGGSQAVSSAALGMWRVNRTIWWLLFLILKNRPKLQLMKFL